MTISEKDKQTLAAFKTAFGGTFSNLREWKEEKPEEIILAANPIENGKRFFQVIRGKQTFFNKVRSGAE